MEKESGINFIKLDFEQARAKHLLFKSKLRSILYGIAIDKSPVLSQYDCNLGKWIYGHALKVYGHIPEVHELEKVHASIHDVARNLIDLYNKGQVLEARAGLKEMEKIADQLVELLIVSEKKLKENPVQELFNKDYSQLLDDNLQELHELQKVNFELDKRFQQSEEQFNTLANSIPNLAWMADGEGYIFWYNQRWYEYTGKTPDEMKGWGWQSVHDPEILPLVLEQWKHSIATGQPFEMVFPLRGVDGIFRSFLTRVFPIRDSQGNVIRWFGSNTDIDEQKRFLEKLEESVKENDVIMQTILQYAPDAVITIDEDGNILSWNPQAEAIFEWSEKEVIGKTLTETIIPERYRKQHIDGMKVFLRTGKGAVINKPIEIFALKKSEVEIPVELKISSSKVNGRHMFIGFVRDISVRKQADETIKNKTLQLVEAQQLAHIGSWEWDVVNNKIVWSDELYRLFGVTPENFEASYENFLKYIFPEDREMVNDIIQKAFTDHQPFKFLHKVVFSDGNVRVISATGKVNVNKEGQTIRMTGTAQDITEQIKYETELRESEERFLKIFDSNPVPMTLSEIKTNKIKYANNLFYAAFGYSPEEVIGHTSEELNLMSREENERVVDIILGAINETRSIAELQLLSVEETEELLSKFKQTDAMKNFEIQYTRKNGKTFPALVSYELIRFGNERFTIASYQDISERKNEQEQLKRQNEKLEKMNKELQSFAYVSSHDLQEPLRKIQTFASRILEKENQNLSDHGKEQFSRMFNAAKRMQTLIEDLLAYSRTNTEELEFESSDLVKVVEEVKEDMKEELQLKKAVIEVEEACGIKIIPFQFRQLLNNLIGNAIKFSKPGVAPYIEIKCEISKGKKFNNPKLLPHQNYCRILFSDNGIGFDSQYSDKIFEVFQRLHDRESYSGTGIGLAIVKKIVENHNGIISATGEVNRGATFEMYIPAG